MTTNKIYHTFLPLLIATNLVNCDQCLSQPLGSETRQDLGQVRVSRSESVPVIVNSPRPLETRGPLFKAIRENNLAELEELLKSNIVDVNQLVDGDAPLSFATLIAATGKPEQLTMVNTLLAVPNINPNVPDKYGKTPLLRAA